MILPSAGATWKPQRNPSHGNEKKAAREGGFEVAVSLLLRSVSPQGNSLR